MKTSNSVRISLLLIFATLLFSLRTSPLCFEHFGDDSVYMTGGWLLTEGWLPYRDFFDHKSPLIYVVYAIGWLLGGRWAYWGFESIVFGLMCFALFRSLETRFGTLTAMMSIASLILLSRSLFFLSVGKPEQWALIACMGMATALFNGFDRYRAWFIAGIWAGIAFLFKVTAISPPVAVGCVGLFCSCRPVLRRRWIKRLMCFITGGLATLALTTLWLASRGIISDFIEACFEYNRHYAAISLDTISPQRLASVIFEQFFSRGVLLLISGSIFLGWIGIRSSASDPVVRFAYSASLLTILFETLLIIMTGRVYPQYFALYCLPFSITIGMAWCRPVKTPTHPLDGLGLMKYAVGASPLIPFIIFSVHWNLIQPAVKPFINPVPALPIENIIAESASRYRGNGKLFVWGPISSKFYHQTRMFPATRYIYGLPLWTPGYATDKRIGTFIETLQQQPPAIIIDMMAGSGRGFSGNRSVSWDDYPFVYYSFPDHYMQLLRAWVRENYTITRTHESSAEIWVYNEFSL